VKAQNRNRLIALGALLVAGAGFAFIALGNMGNNLVYYWTPGEMMRQGDKAFSSTIRLGGIVKKGSVQWNPEHTQLSFRVADGKDDAAFSVLVTTSEIPPQMFREGMGVVVEGTYERTGTFNSNRLMVSHSNEYRPPKAGEHDDWRKSLADPTASRQP